MIESFVNVYKKNNRDIDVLTYVVIAFLIVFAVRAAMLIYECRYHDLWPLMPQAVPLLSVIVVVRVANRMIANGNIIRENDRRQEFVQTIHHLIAITTDLRVKVDYAKAVLTEGGRPPIALTQIAKSIEERYEALLQRDGYKFLPGPCVNIITRISGSIFGIGILAEAMNQATAEKPALALKPLPASSDAPLSPQFDELMKDLQELLDQLFELRSSIDVVKGKR